MHESPVRDSDHCRISTPDHSGQTKGSRQRGIGSSRKHTSPIRLLPLLFLIAGCAAERPPNIVLIMADDMGYETLGVNGGLSYDTPHLDSLAQHGMRFTHAFSTPLCTPSRVQLMTGKYNFRNYIGFGLLDPAEQTFAHLLQDVGYATGVAGKWQLYGNMYQRELAGRGGSTPEEAGFEEFALWQYIERGSRYKSPTIHYSGQEPETFPDAYGPDLYTDYIEEFFERHQDEPFFLYFPMALPHDPFLPPPGHPDFDSLDIATARNDTAYFAPMLNFVDKLVGRITGKLHELELDRNTLVLFTTDNGTHRIVSSQHKTGLIRGRKAYPVAAGTHVPLIAYWPGTIQPNIVNDALVDFTDFLPTLIEAAGSSVPDDFTADGLSFYDQLTGLADTTRSWIYCHYDPRWGRFAPARWAQDQTWKLYGNGQFFNWSEDRDEVQALDDSTLDERAQLAKNKLQGVLDQMPALPQVQSED
ncbi:MAG: sulfatase-like hydrolase/transferase [Rhodothermaceae bacterium]|nr:sulfatase-like hydrolase/transferase [Rhodothermaceae bacterium]MXZ18300.1 sulfatase-like hydrolase/transferase [Rhodothermaceae bacterium]MYE62351.1 sulfatase-like hydrolase/transferase [Rhodothermaceae bacterium]MYG69625.1 sulfatase-like hydrolase/transferase [Rhodothermaceae bacterium]MYJ19245.1 sulfatase-like hydrolase/transferase [Rhodothermaceae bacterium]